VLDLSFACAATDFSLETAGGSSDDDDVANTHVSEILMAGGNRLIIGGDACAGVTDLESK
jgi:hypothetical protein